MLSFYQYLDLRVFLIVCVYRTITKSILNTLILDPRLSKNRQKHFIEKICISNSKGAIYGPSSLIGNIVSLDLKVKVKLIRTPFFNITSGTTHERVEAEQKSLLYFGTLSYSKGVDLFAETLPQILKKYRSVTVRFVGRDTPLVIKDTSITQKLLKLFIKYRNSENVKMFSDFIREQTHDFSDRVSFSPVVKPKKMQEIISDSDIIVLPSRIDNFPNTLSESLSAGKIVIAPTNSSLDEIISDGKNGFVFENGNSSDLAIKIEHALNLSMSEAMNIRKNASKSVAELYPSRVIKGELLNFYNLVIN